MNDPKVPMYGQVVVGPPGSGKTTYCNGMQQYLRLIGRDTVVVNLDPANDVYLQQQQQQQQPNNALSNEKNNSQESSEPPQAESSSPSEEFTPYEVLLDVSEEIINLTSVMEELELGPNGGLIYCLEYILHHITSFTSILQSKLQAYQKQSEHNFNTTSSRSRPPYILFDLPGQVELYTHTNTIQNILQHLIKTLDLRLVMVQLIDAHHCMDVHKFISSALLSTTTMLRLELPAVNILSKIDLLHDYNHVSGGDGDGVNNGDDGSALSMMPFNLDFFLECQELDRLLPYLNDTTASTSLSSSSATSIQQQLILDNDIEYQNAKNKLINNKFTKKYHKLHYQLCDILNDFSLLNYIPLDINDAESVGRVVVRVDKCNGYIFMTNDCDHNDSGGTVTSGGGKRNEYEHNVQDMFQCAMQVDRDWGFEHISDIQERYMGMYQDQLPELTSASSSSRKK